MGLADGEAWERENGPPPPRALSDVEHAKTIRDLAEQLVTAINAASNVGLDVNIDARSIEMQSLGNAKAVPVWRLDVQTARPL